MTNSIKSIDDYNRIYKKSIEHPEQFWSEVALEYSWDRKWDKVLDWNFKEPNVKWYHNGKLNITNNCLDRHLDIIGDKTALIWEPNSPTEYSKKYTYKELHSQVCKASNILKEIGVSKGDRVCIYMPMIPEVAFLMLACARIGAIHSVVFAGFSAMAIRDRMIDAKAEFVITSDSMKRGSKTINLKEIVDEAIYDLSFVKRVLVVEYINNEFSFNPNIDSKYYDLYSKVTEFCPYEVMDSEDIMFILYTSGSTGKPKGVVHTCGGYMTYVGYSFQNVFQLENNDVFWCSADVGWITGHSYLLYGPLLNGGTTLMFEGIPTYPDIDRFWKVIDKHQVNFFYTAPTAIRALMAFGTEQIKKHDLSSIKKLGSVGEPINMEAYNWFKDNIGKGVATLIDTWWQTETGGIMITDFAGITEPKPCYAGYPMPGVELMLVTQDGDEILDSNVEGSLCIKHPWPSMIRSTYGDHDRCRLNYFATYPQLYFTGDGAYRDENGKYRVIGRVDDVINVSGHRFGTAEIENAINQDPSVIESAVVGYPHNIKGQGIYAYVLLDSKYKPSDEIYNDIISTLVKQIGHIAKPDKIQFVNGLPKTRSGKIMRRILRKIACGDTDSLGDTSTLIDSSVVQEIIKGKS